MINQIGKACLALAEEKTRVFFCFLCLSNKDLVRLFLCVLVTYVKGSWFSEYKWHYLKIKSFKYTKLGIQMAVWNSLTHYAASQIIRRDSCPQICEKRYPKEVPEIPCSHRNLDTTVPKSPLQLLQENPITCTVNISFTEGKKMQVTVKSHWDSSTSKIILFWFLEARLCFY